MSKPASTITTTRPRPPRSGFAQGVAPVLLWPRTEAAMILFLVILLVILWAIGMVTTTMLGGWLHILLVIAVVTSGPRTFSEDWIAVALAVFVIALVLAGVRPAVPRFAWTTPQQLTATVFAASNLISALQLGILVLIPATAGAILLGIRP